MPKVKKTRQVPTPYKKYLRKYVMDNIDSRYSMMEIIKHASDNWNDMKRDKADSKAHDDARVEAGKMECAGKRPPAGKCSDWNCNDIGCCYAGECRQMCDPLAQCRCPDCNNEFGEL